MTASLKWRPGSRAISRRYRRSRFGFHLPERLALALAYAKTADRVPKNWPRSSPSERRARLSAMTVCRDRLRSGPLLAHSRAGLLWPVAVRLGDYFPHVTVGVLEIEAATAVQMIDLARLGAPRIGVIADALSADAGECRVELGIANKQRVMPRTKLFAGIEIERHAVRRLDRDEMTPFRPRLEIEDIAEELGRDPFVFRWDDRVIKFDTHLVLPFTISDSITSSVWARKFGK